MKRKLESKNIDDIRHDLKNHLTIILGYTELLDKKIKTEKERRWIKEILNESRKLTEAIDKELR